MFQHEQLVGGTRMPVIFGHLPIYAALVVLPDIIWVFTYSSPVTAILATKYA